MKELLFFFCLSIQFGWAQPGFNIGYSMGYHSNRFYDVAIKNDTIIAYGSGQDSLAGFKKGVMVARFDTLGNLIDKIMVLDTSNSIYSIDRSYGRLIATADGGYAMTTVTISSGDGVFIKVNNKLELEFNQRYRDTINYSEFLVSPIEIPDGYLLYGFYNIASTGKSNAILRKVDKQGNLVWRKNFGLDNWYESFRSAIVLNDTTFLIGGSKYLDFPEWYPTGIPWICIFNQHGELKFEWQAPSPDAFNGLRIGRLFPKSDSSWIANGSQYLGLHPVYGFKRYQAYWVGLDKDFKYKWSKPYGPNINQFDILPRIIQTPEKDLIGFGQRGPFDSNVEGFYQKGWVMRFSTQGDSLWEWTGKAPIPNPGAHFFSGGALLSSGSIVAAGSGDAENGYPVCWLVKLSPDGCVDTLFCHTTSAVEAPAPLRAGLQMFPNPARDQVSLRFYGQETTEVALLRFCDLSGRVVRAYMREDLKGPLSLAGLAAGLYIVQTVSEKGVVLGCEKLAVCP
jgi:Secretion system C-terminal sorting domain